MFSLDVQQIFVQKIFFPEKDTQHFNIYSTLVYKNVPPSVYQSEYSESIRVYLSEYATVFSFPLNSTFNCTQQAYMFM